MKYYRIGKVFTDTGDFDIPNEAQILGVHNAYSLKDKDVLGIIVYYAKRISSEEYKGHYPRHLAKGKLVGVAAEDSTPIEQVDKEDV